MPSQDCDEIEGWSPLAWLMSMAETFLIRYSEDTSIWRLLVGEALEESQKLVIPSIQSLCTRD